MTEEQKLIEDAKDQIYRVLVVLNPDVEPDIYEQNSFLTNWVVKSVIYKQPIMIQFNIRYKEFIVMDENEDNHITGKGRTAVEAVKHFLDDKYAFLYNEYATTEIQLKRIGDLIDDLECMGDGI